MATPLSEKQASAIAMVKEYIALFVVLPGGFEMIVSCLVALTGMPFAPKCFDPHAHLLYPPVSPLSSLEAFMNPTSFPTQQPLLTPERHTQRTTRFLETEAAKGHLVTETDLRDFHNSKTPEWEHTSGKIITPSRSVNMYRSPMYDSHGDLIETDPEDGNDLDMSGFPYNWSA